MNLVIFDWNGTLFLDSFAWILSHQNYCEKHGHPAPEPDVLAEVIFGADNHDYIGRLDTFYTSIGITVDWATELKVFKELYRKHSANAPLHYFAKMTIAELLNRGIFVHVLSASKAHDSLPHIKRHGMDELLGNSAFTLEREDKVPAIHEIAVQYGVELKDICMIGDTPGDVHSANEAGITSIALRTLHVPPDIVYNAKPDHYIHCLSHVVGIVEGRHKPLTY